jgi:hypothetical protein
MLSAKNSYRGDRFRQSKTRADKKRQEKSKAGTCSEVKKAILFSTATESIPFLETFWFSLVLYYTQNEMPVVFVLYFVESPGGFSFNVVELSNGLGLLNYSTSCWSDFRK